ncbi:Hsp70 family protein [Nodosilinea sp. LEGE 07298]|uniref:Hsp70 family protein n=1 Tax=Nodosilinea sp. LEGE 07298 TaxID=2777970 RepID=UPI00188193DE|nr:Hsp70 family protein [Nodosilinea sp. LEGE 07298]MBE9110445.1 Hsp70 family protein [Nodosilinea sp. LEGE 07298]
MAIAVDFGTSNTVIARWNPATESPETLALPGLSSQLQGVPPLVPSLVYVEKPQADGVVVGQAVRDRGLDITADPRFFANIKRGIGAPLQGFLPEIDGQALSFEQLGEWFLRSLLTQVRQVAGDDDSLVLTVPVDSFEAYRLWLGDVAIALDFSQVRLIDEPTAAALGYGLSGEQTLLVLDFGGGTLDWSLVRLVAPARQPVGFLLKWRGQGNAQTSTQKPEVARVLAKAGENLGGADIDQWLMAHFQTQGVPDGPVVQRLAERLKIALSTQTEAAEAYFDDETFDTYDLALTRDQFEAILSQNQFFERLEKGLAQVVQQGQRQGVDQDAIDAVLLVGGTAQIPALQRWVIERFGAEKVRCDRPFEAVAQGALQIAQGLAVEDFLYHSYGIRYWDRRNNRHGWHSILPQGQPYPMVQPVELTLGASVEKQPSIELIVGELGAASTQTEVYFENGRLVTRQLGGDAPSVQPLNDREGARTIAQLDPLGFPGSDRVRVLFRVDGDRLLRITVEDILTGNTLLDNQPVVRLN